MIQFRFVFTSAHSFRPVRGCRYCCVRQVHVGHYEITGLIVFDKNINIRDAESYLFISQATMINFRIWHATMPGITYFLYWAKTDLLPEGLFEREEYLIEIGENPFDVPLPIEVKMAEAADRI